MISDYFGTRCCICRGKLLSLFGFCLLFLFAMATDNVRDSTTSDMGKEEADVCETPMSAPASRHATFASNGIPRRPSRPMHSSEPAMTTYHTSLSSVSQRIGRGLKTPIRQLKKGFRKDPEHPAIPSIPKEETTRLRGEPVKFSIEDILAADPAPATEGRLAYPQFDSFERYCLSGNEEICNELWRREAARLHHHVQYPDSPIRFQNRTYFTSGDERGYRTLSRLADKILTAMSLCTLDNEVINAQYCKSISNRDKLQKLIQQAHVTAEADHGDDFDTKNTIQVARHQSEQEALSDLISYISAVLARLITQTGTGKYWQATVLCVLAKRVVKIKALLLDLGSNARIAAQEGESALDSSRDAGSRRSTLVDEEEECEEALRMIDADTRDGLTSVDEAEVAAYCVNQNKFRSGMSFALRSIVSSLRSGNRSGTPVTSFEICGLVYETGFQGFKTMLFQDRNMEYSATSDLDNLNTADSAFRILNKTVDHLKHLAEEKTAGASPGPPRANSTPTAPATAKVKSFIEWTYKVTDHSIHGPPSGHKNALNSIELEFMDDIITILVPLAATSPSLVSELNNFRSIMLFCCESDELTRPYQETNFTAFFRVYTNKFQDRSEQQEGLLRLKAAFEDGTFERYRLIQPSDTNVDSSNPSKNSSSDAKSAREFEDRTWVMENEWVTDESSIIVPCPTYVLSIGAVALMLAAGGLTIGFTVGTSIEGVDPFNLATYTWVLAAFIILVCKSVLVREWSWSDFLHVRVRCRSVSELEAVTGIRAQLIIAKLLHDESGGGILVTRGPYNSIFRKRSAEGGEGFAIDRPISTTTMLMSGLTPLQVVTPRGQALVCLDARRGTGLRLVGHQANAADQYLVCEDVNRLRKLAKEGSNAGEKGKCMRLQLLLSKELKWKRVLGIYDAQNVVFV
ncbi:hypothetical protein B0H67DRAFT_580601 [Lasiosphaeris hirsuta]|uniref:Uncharacterized protein n=1 Tax=Lasiosphaeris hirsuta TaxID=260670 RepID=A0AA40DTA6_9PEZI|nr:hypothetical protein B0H67DRAFT_580601 [Lasiosphaeris hirsuta]